MMSNCVRGTLLIAASLAIAGCAVGPDYTAPADETPGDWQLPDDAQLGGGASEHAEWWESFNDPALNRLVERARSQNLSLRIAGLRILESRALLGIAEGQRFPQQQQINGDVTAIEVSANAPNASLADRSYTRATVGLDVSWEADFWGRFKRGIEAADALLDADVANFDDALVLLSAETAQSYISVRLLQERLRLAKANEASQARALEIASVLFDNGATTELDVTQAKTILGSTRASVPALEAILRQSENALAVLLGEPPGGIDTLIGASAGIPTAPATVTVGIPAELLRRRPDIRAAERQLAAQSALIGVATADLYPRLGLAGSVGFQSSDASSLIAGSSELGDLFRSESASGFLGPFVSWNIFNYGRIKNNIRIEDARFQQLLLNYQNTVLSALAESDTAIVAFLNAKKEAQFLTYSADAAVRSVELAGIQYREGETDFNRVVSALQAAIQQQDQLAQSQGAIASNLVTLYRALGGGWQSYGEDYVPDDVKQQMLERSKYWRGILE
jgi:NodT family efflux transporter outer membrane factor (OMF) lipoprotein